MKTQELQIRPNRRRAAVLLGLSGNGMSAARANRDSDTRSRRGRRDVIFTRRAATKLGLLAVQQGTRQNELLRAPSCIPHPGPLPPAIGVFLFVKIPSERFALLHWLRKPLTEGVRAKRLRRRTGGASVKCHDLEPWMGEAGSGGAVTRGRPAREARRERRRSNGTETSTWSSPRASMDPDRGGCGAENVWKFAAGKYRGDFERPS